MAFQPAFDPDDLTVNTALNALSDMGNTRFMARADNRFAECIARIEALREAQQSATQDVPVIELLNSDNPELTNQ